MKRFFSFVVVLVFLCNMKACSQGGGVCQSVAERETVADTMAFAVPLGAKTLLTVYPDFVKSYSDGFLALSNGTKIVYDDKKQKNDVERMDDADIEDMFVQKYDTGVWHPTPNYDPGRVRNEQLMKYMYGGSEREVRKNLVRVKWFNQQLLFTKINGAADSLRAVAKELEKLPVGFRKYFEQSSTFNWRTVRGCNRLSAHSYGNTIDICTKYSDFWRWKNPGKNEMDEIVYVNRIPREIIRIFEKHGFISGARWYHYDTMHFEFRPDLLQYSKGK